MVLALALVAIPHGALAQQPERISLREALRLFGVNSLELRLARARAAEAAGLARQAGAFPNPTLTVTHEPLSGDGTSYEESYLNLSQRIELPGKRGARSGAAERVREAAYARLRADSVRLAFEMKRAFVEAALAEERSRLTERVTDVFRVATSSASARFGEGDVSLYDVRRIGLEQARYENLVGDAALSAGTAARALAMLVAPQGEVALLATEPLPAELPPPMTEMEATLMGAAAERRPELAAVGADLEAARAAARLARAERLPDVTATGGYKRQSDGPTGAFLGLSVPIPLFDRGSGAVAAADARVLAAEDLVTLTRRQLGNDVVRAADAYRSLRDRAELLLVGVGDAPGDVLDIAQVAYDAGEMELVGLLDAAEALREARLAEVRLRADVWIAYYDLERALGGLDPAGAIRPTEGGL